MYLRENQNFPESLKLRMMWPELSLNLGSNFDFTWIDLSPFVKSMVLSKIRFMMKMALTVR